MKILLKILFVLFATNLFAQEEIIEALGFRHIQTVYKNDTVDILIKSKEGEADIPKPIFLFCQGSLPQPLIKYSDEMAFNVFPFITEKLCEDYHLVIISKPFIPIVSDVQQLGNVTLLLIVSAIFQKSIQKEIILIIMSIEIFLYSNI
jgi:hypothetical protein